MARRAVARATLRGMAGRRRRALAWALFATTLVTELVAVPLSFGLEPAWDTWIYAVYTLTYAAAGALIARRHPRNAVGWLLLATGVSNALVADLAQGYGLRAAEEGWPHGPFFEWLSIASWMFGGALLMGIFLLFPDGRLASRRWHAVIGLMAVALAVGIPGWALDPDSGEMFVGGTNPYAVASLPTDAMYAVGLALFCLALLLSIVAVLVRLARASRRRAPAAQAVRARQRRGGGRPARGCGPLVRLPGHPRDLGDRAGGDAALGRGGDPPPPALRHRPRHQPHAGLRRADRGPGPVVRRGDGPSGHLARPGLGLGDRRRDVGGGAGVPAGPRPDPGRRGPAVRPPAVGRRAPGGRVRRAAPRRRGRAGGGRARCCGAWSATTRSR